MEKTPKPENHPHFIEPEKGNKNRNYVDDLRIPIDLETDLTGCQRLLITNEKIEKRLLDWKNTLLSIIQKGSRDQLLQSLESRYEIFPPFRRKDSLEFITQRKIIEALNAANSIDEFLTEEERKYFIDSVTRRAEEELMSQEKFDIYRSIVLDIVSELGIDKSSITIDMSTNRKGEVSWYLKIPAENITKDQKDHLIQVNTELFPAFYKFGNYDNKVEIIQIQNKEFELDKGFLIKKIKEIFKEAYKEYEHEGGYSEYELEEFDAVEFNNVILALRYNKDFDEPDVFLYEKDCLNIRITDHSHTENSRFLSKKQIEKDVNLFSPIPLIFYVNLKEGTLTTHNTARLEEKSDIRYKYAYMAEGLTKEYKLKNTKEIIKEELEELTKNID